MITGWFLLVRAYVQISTLQNGHETFSYFYRKFKHLKHIIAVMSNILYHYLKRGSSQMEYTYTSSMRCVRVYLYSHTKNVVCYYGVISTSISYLNKHSYFLEAKYVLLCTMYVHVYCIILSDCHSVGFLKT